MNIQGMPAKYYSSALVYSLLFSVVVTGIVAGTKQAEGVSVVRPAASCTDSDGGQITTVVGTVTVNGRNKFEDKCVGATRVRETFCRNKKVKKITLSCKSGYQCLNGACISPSSNDAYVVAIPQNVLNQHPDGIAVIDGILLKNENSVHNFMHTNSNGKFNLATETHVVQQPYPNMFSVISDLDAQVDWKTKKGIFIVYDGDCDGVVDRGGGGLPRQEFTSNDDTVSLMGIMVADCTIFDNPDENRTRYVFLHELSHSLITPGHANLVGSIAYDPFGDYRGNPKANSICSIPFNSMDPEIRNESPQRGCPVTEYGDPFDILGDKLAPYTTYSMAEKQLAGFVPETSVNTLKLKERGMSLVTIYPQNVVNPEKYLTHVKIMEGTYGFYSIEYRTQLEPLFSTSKLLIRYAFEGSNTLLLAALSPGETYSNPTDNFSVIFQEVRGHDPMTARVKIQLQ